MGPVGDFLDTGNPNLQAKKRPFGREEKLPALRKGTLPETNSKAPTRKPSQKERIAFQPSIFRCYVSYRGGYIMVYTILY